MKRRNAFRDGLHLYMERPTFKEMEKIKMKNCPVCGEELITITGYTRPNYCRKCDKLFWGETQENDNEK